MSKPFSTDDPLAPLVTAEQVRAHYSQIPLMAIAPAAGGLFSSWVLWGGVRHQYLVAGMMAVCAISVTRLFAYQKYSSSPIENRVDFVWRATAVVIAFVSGCVWGGIAPLMYPPSSPEYSVYLLILSCLVPIVPVSALAVYMPAFYAYYIPSVVPFIVTLALQNTRPDSLSAVVLLMMMGATISFARRYSESLSEAIRLRIKLSKKSTALEALVKQKSQFIAAASHDLQQPVHAMGMFMESLRQQERGDKDRRLVDYLDASLRNLSNLLTNILYISRLEANAVNIKRVQFAIEPIISMLASEYEPLAAENGLGLRHRCGDLYVASDPALIERMLRNLLSNALKYTNRGGVFLACRPRGNSVLLQVFDTGIGIRQECLNQIFEDFTQVDNPEGLEERGFGLGLAIVRRMADLLNHKISVVSRYSRGSTFTIEVPRSTRGRGSPEVIADMGPFPEARPQIVLIIDDDDLVARGISTLLQQWGHNTIICSSASNALGALSRSNEIPDLLISDFRLGAEELCLQEVESIRKKIRVKIPVILLTADTSPNSIRAAYLAGHVLLHKPVEPLRLRACMAALAAPSRTGSGSLRRTA